jgi:hypothetical protein
VDSKQARLARTRDEGEEQRLLGDVVPCDDGTPYLGSVFRIGVTHRGGYGEFYLLDFKLTLNRLYVAN